MNLGRVCGRGGGLAALDRNGRGVLLDGLSRRLGGYSRHAILGAPKTRYSRGDRKSGTARGRCGGNSVRLVIVCGGGYTHAPMAHRGVVDR